MARGKRKREPTEAASSVKTLVEALKFCQLAAHSIGQPYQSHVMLMGGRAVAFDGVLAAGTYIPDETQACPHLARLIAALSKCGEQVGITQLDNTRLSIRSDKFKATVECIDPNSVPPIGPDQAALEVDNRLVKALTTAALLASDSSQEVVTASVWLTNKYAYGTNKAVMFRAEHGFSLPGDLVIPKTAVNAVNKSGKEVTHLGASQSSVTFWFSDGSWLRSQLYSDPWPTDAVKRIMADATRTAPVKIPESFFEAVEAVKPFTEVNSVFFTKSGVSSHADEAQGAKYDCSGLNAGMCFNPDYLLLLEDHVETMDMHTIKNYIYAFGLDFAAVVLAKPQ